MIPKSILPCWSTTPNLEPWRLPPEACCNSQTLAHYSTLARTPPDIEVVTGHCRLVWNFPLWCGNFHQVPSLPGRNFSVENSHGSFPFRWSSILETLQIGSYLRSAITIIFLVLVLYFQSGNTGHLPTSRLLSESLEFENLEERRLMEIMHMDHEPPKPKKSPVAYRWRLLLELLPYF